ncbi:MAG: hypothetical protein AB7G28_20760 [Pirellulales bacterium]
MNAEGEECDWHGAWMLFYERSHDPALPVQVVATRGGFPTQMALGLDNQQAREHVIPKIAQVERMGS